MLSVTSAELDAWLGMLLLPFARIAALVGAAPILGHVAVPMRVKLGLALLVTFVIAPGLPPPAVSIGSGAGLLSLALQVAVGAAMALAVRVSLSAVDLAGEMIGMQMGLSFAVAYDPQSAMQVPVVSQMLAVISSLTFLALDGHLIMLSLLAESFRAFPPDAVRHLPGIATLLAWGGQVFSAGLLLSLPAVVALLITNLALGVLTRAAPQLNIFAVGFPITLAVGFAAVAVSLPYLARPLAGLFEQGLATSAAMLLQGAR